MFIASVNIGAPQPMKTKSGRSGIYKQPVTHEVLVTKEGLAADFIADHDHHGGVDQAVYVYTAPDLDWWSQELGRQLPPGAFGENLLLSELTSAQFCIGDRFLMGDVILEVTSYRMPCVTLAARMNDKMFVKRFNDAKLHGAYCRVIAEGKVQAGMKFCHQPFSGAKVRLVEMAEKYPIRGDDAEFIGRVLQTPAHWKTLRDLERAF